MKDCDLAMKQKRFSSARALHKSRFQVGHIPSRVLDAVVMHLKHELNPSCQAYLDAYKGDSEVAMVEGPKSRLS
jgi:hypothetical protein